MNKDFDKKVLKDKIALMIRNQHVDESILHTMSLQQLMEEISIYHQELIYQNDELSRRSMELEEEKAWYQAFSRIHQLDI